MKAVLNCPSAKATSAIRRVKESLTNNMAGRMYHKAEANREKLDAQTDLLELMRLWHRSTFVLSFTGKHIMKTLIKNLIKGKVILYCLGGAQLISILFR